MMGPDELASFLAARAGKLTASRMGVAMSFKKDGTPTKERSDLQRALLAERLTGSTVRNFVTDAMQFGLDFEDEAKAAYEAETGVLLLPSGVIDHPRIDNFAATPDAYLPDGGLAEFKVPTSPTFVDWVLAGVVPEMHKPQLLAQLACTGRAFVEFVAFDPRVKDRRRRLFIRRFVPTPEEIEKVEAAAKQFLDEIDLLWERFHDAAA